MGARNGDTVFDVIRNGAWKRKIRDINGQGDLGISIPKDVTDEQKVEEGDIAVLKAEGNQIVVDFGDDE